MFIITAKLNIKRMIAGGALAILLSGVLISAGRQWSTAGLDAVADIPLQHADVASNEARVEYLEQCGWEVSDEPLAVEELLIPENFDDSYQSYLSLQSDQGFDLTELCGKRVKRYTYVVINHPSGEAGVQANLLIYKDEIVGGEVLSGTAGGFLHGLQYPVDPPA